MVASAFDVANTMDGGGDMPEDVLLGLVFSTDHTIITWDPTSTVRLLSVFTDNPYHYEDDTAEIGTVTAPLSAWPATSGAFGRNDS